MKHIGTCLEFYDLFVLFCSGLDLFYYIYLVFNNLMRKLHTVKLYPSAQASDTAALRLSCESYVQSPVRGA